MKSGARREDGARTASPRHAHRRKIVKLGSKAPDVGAPDPERTTSPILDDDFADEDSAAYGLEADTGVCYFNDQPFDIGEYVCSGNDLLRCEKGGVWVRKGPCVPT
jgi:hypothetical protein